MTRAEPGPERARHRRISVIVVAYQSEPHIAAACESAAVAAAHAGLELELIVVDNASTDRSVEIVRRSFPGAIVIENATNVGYGAACNQAFEIAKADLWLLLNPDAVLPVEALGGLVTFLDSHPSAGAVAPRIVGSAQVHSDNAGMAPGLRSMAGHFLLLNRALDRGAWRGYFLHRGSDSRPARVDWAGGAILLVRRAAMSAVGNFDPAFFLYGEDVDLGIRLNRAGWEVWLDRSTTASHRIGASQPADSTRWVDGTLEVVRRESGPTRAWLVALVMALGLAVRAVLAGTRADASHDGRYRRAMRAAAKRAFRHLVDRTVGMQAPPGNVVPDAPHANATAAVIVTHEPDESVSRMVRDVAQQVDAVVVVDNGSRPAVVAALERWRDELGVATILNGGNRGLAPALNQGLAWAAERGYPWALLLDQDATPRRGLVASAHDAFREARHTNVAVISAASDGRRTRDCRCIAEETAAAITAGSVHSVAAWRALGGFREDFFTDYVDIEYCLRARESGYVILRLCRSAIEHEVGRPSQHRLGGRLVTTTNHDRDRRYHITRNRVLVWRRYARREARFVWRDIRAFVKESVKLALFEDDRVRKGGAIVRGLADGVRGPADGIATG